MPADTAKLGKPITGNFSISGGEARLFQRGLSISGQAGEARATFDFPKVGRPIVGSGASNLPVSFGLRAIKLERANWEPVQLAKAVRSALEERLVLTPTGIPHAAAIQLTVGDVVELDAGEASDATHGLNVTGSGLSERQLYDIVIESHDGHRHVVAPHAIYHRTDWTNFGFAHVTDMHVARRIDHFRRLLKGAGHPLSAEKMYNWNDRFRGFVKYANYLHSIGKLDVIFATGDLYDYIYERDEEQTGGGNAQFLRDLILGKAPGPEFPEVQELRVPIYMVPGNHDYRNNPYDLIFDVHIPGKDLTRIKNYSGYHISDEAARVLGNLLAGRLGSDVPNISSVDAGRQVEINVDPPCRGLLCDAGSYAVMLGPHKFLMFDTRHDIGVVDDPWEGLKYWAGFADEDELTFVGGSPNCDGIKDEEVAWAARELSPDAEEGKVPDSGEGLLVIGLHAPLLNMWGNEYPYYLRETQRQYQPDQTEAYLARHQLASIFGGGVFGGNSGFDFDKVRAKIRAEHPTWFRPDHDHRSTTFVKRGDISDKLDYGVASSREHAPDGANALLRLLTGIGASRPAELVLAGHTHRHNEFRLRVEDDGELRFYMDFYTQNPSTYYPTRYLRSWPSNLQDIETAFDVTYVDVVPGSPGDMRPWPISGWMHKNVVQVPPYPNPLNSAQDARQWWDQHRPVILQTGALGPLDDSQASFTGFRVIAVTNNLIEKIHFIPTDRLEARQYELPWDEAIRIDEPPHKSNFIGRTEQYGMPSSASAPCICPIQNRGTFNIIYRDDGRRLYELWSDGSGASGAGNLTAAANAPLATGDPSAYFDTVTNSAIMLYRGQDGHIHSLYSSGGLTGHDNLSAAAGAPKAAGNPVGYFTAGRNVNHVIYRSGDGHLRAIYWRGAETAQHADLMGGSGAPKAAGDPSAFFGAESNIVVYRASDGHVHSLYWLDGPVGHDNLSGSANLPPAKGEPIGYYTPQGDVYQVTYRGNNGHLYELWWLGTTTVGGWDLTASSGAPPAVSDPTAYFNPTTNAKHVIYTSGDGRIHELTWTPGTATVKHIDLTGQHQIPPSAGRPAAFINPSSKTRHVVARGTNGHLYEIVSSYAASGTEGGGSNGGLEWIIGHAEVDPTPG